MTVFWNVLRLFSALLAYIGSAAFLVGFGAYLPRCKREKKSVWWYFCDHFHQGLLALAILGWLAFFGLRFLV